MSLIKMLAEYLHKVSVNRSRSRSIIYNIFAIKSSAEVKDLRYTGCSSLTLDTNRLFKSAWKTKKKFVEEMKYHIASETRTDSSSAWFLYLL